MTSLNFDPKLTSLPLCHAKMGILPTPSYSVSQNHLPPSPYLGDVIYEWSLCCQGSANQQTGLPVSLVQLETHFVK